MPEPAATYILLQTSLGDAYSRLITRLTSGMDSKLSSIDTHLSNIEEAINNQNQAHFKAAYMALKDRNTEQALNNLRMGLSVDELNANGWAIYAGIHGMQGNHDRALEIFQQMIDWFGTGCPALPKEILEACKSNGSGIGLPSSVPVTIKHIAESANCDWTSVGVSRFGAASVYLRNHLSLSNQGHLVVQYRLWFPPKRQAYSSDIDAYISLGEWDKSRPPVITGMTGRYLVLCHTDLFDLTQGGKKIHADYGLLQRTFGNGEGVVSLSTNNPDLKISAERGCEAGFFDPGGGKRPQITITAKVVDPSSEASKNIIQLSPDLLSILGRNPR